MNFKIKLALNFCGLDYYKLFAKSPQKFIAPLINNYYGDCWNHISTDSELLFIHIPKNAGTSVVKSVYNRVYGHYPASFYAANDKEKYQRFIKFAIVRNPYDRFISIFNHYFSSPYATSEELDIGKNFFANYKYPDQLAYDIRKNNKVKAFYKTLIHALPQIYWLMVDNKLAIDYLFSFEEINKVEKFLQDTLQDSNFVLPNINVSNTQNNAKRNIGNDSKEFVEKFYKEDLKLWESLK